ncbi:MAG: Sulfite exporter TauE/SafE [Acidobacteria bacterium]|nr:Sulfite exporter TauE/SafE [Acidobacteriota bacterium]
MELTLTTGILIAAVSFAAEYVDSSLGMGYGTTLTPVLLLMGFAPLEVVPALLVSQLLAGLLSGFVHHSMGNVNLKPLTLSPSVIWRNVRRFGVRESFRRGLPRGLQVALVITVASVVGTVAAVLLAVNLPEKALRLYVAALVLAIGIVILVTIKLHLAFSWKRIVGLGMLAAFNKGLSGGGYGPLVTGGQVLSGVPVRETVGITSVAEAFTCLVGIVAYAFQPEAVWRLAPYLAAGALLSVPLTGWTVRALRPQWLRVGIGVITITLGTVTIIQTVV